MDIEMIWMYNQHLILLLNSAKLGQFLIFLLATGGIWVPIGLINNPGVKKVVKLDIDSQRNSRVPYKIIDMIQSFKFPVLFER